MEHLLKRSPESYLYLCLILAGNSPENVLINLSEYGSLKVSKHILEAYILFLDIINRPVFI
jgi:hypothetical protein